MTNRLLMRFLFVLITCLGFLSASSAQSSLRGVVIAGDTKKPIALANVFLSNTSVGTITNDNGEFVITQFPAGRFDLVVSCIGYEAYITTLQSAQLPAQLQVVLQPKVNILQEVIVAPYEKNGWEKWGKFFMDYFVGTSENAAQCKLKNPEVVRFRYNKKDKIIQAFADEPLVLENRALGYVVKYELKTFAYDYNTSIFYYQGYPFFEDMETGRSRVENRWKRNRADAYYGSMMHFMRSLFRNELIDDGFEVRKLIKVSQAEKQRVKDLYNARIRPGADGRIIISDSLIGNGNRDSAEYYKKVMRQPEKMNVLINQVLPGDSIAYGIDSFTAGLFFPDHLQVIYKYKQVPAAYANSNPMSVHPKSPLLSEIYLTNRKPVSVLANGSFFEALDLIASGYWGWWEKMATMLPFDYKPPARIPDGK